MHYNPYPEMWRHQEEVRLRKDIPPAPPSPLLLVLFILSLLIIVMAVAYHFGWLPL